MSEISKITTLLKGTSEAEKILTVENNYADIKNQQAVWYEKSKFYCPDGCGECCRNFEPDLLECEALYMAAWLIENQPEIADAICKNQFPFPENKGCPFWDEKNPLHCTIYGGRPFICRLFGACGNRSKDNSIVFKPCKFYPAEKLALFRTPLQHKQYNQKETEEIFNTLPPVMSDLMEKAISINPDNQETELIRNILPKTIQRLKWLCSLNNENLS